MPSSYYDKSHFSTSDHGACYGAKSKIPIFCLSTKRLKCIYFMDYYFIKRNLIAKAHLELQVSTILF